MSTDINRVKYGGLDFNTHLDDLLSRMQVKFAAVFNDFVATGVGMMMVDLIAYGLDSLSFYLDRRATDSFMVTARTRKSVSRLARQLGYKMRSAVCSSTTLKVSLKNGPYAFNVVIPTGFQFLSTTGLIFEASQDVTIPAGTLSGVEFDVPVYEGETFNETFTSDGSINQEYQLRRVPVNKNIVSGTSGSSNAFSARVNALPWLEEDFMTYDPTNQYEVEYTSEPPVLRFGDGLTGNIPPTGASIQVKYVASKGKSGNTASGTITKTKATLVVFFTQIPLNVNNPTPSTGGSDPETLASAKSLAPRVYKTREVAVTADDYQSLSEAYSDPLYGSVSVAKAICSRSADDDLFLVSALDDLQDLLGSTTLPGTPVYIVDSAVTAGTSDLDAIDAAISEITTLLSSVATKMTDISSNTSSAQSRARLSKQKLQEVVSDCSDISTLVTDGKAAVDAIAPAGADGLTAATKTALKEYFTGIQTNSNAINSTEALVDGYMDDIVNATGQVLSDVGVVGTTTTTGKLGDLTTQKTAIETAAGVVGPPSTGLRKVLEDIYAAIVSGSESLTVALDETSKAIFDHVDLMLAADCKTNLITVPILVLDAAGFFAAPSEGLIRSLKTYLDARKEVTQVVEVVSGEPFLVYTDLTIRVGMVEGYSLSVAESSVRAVVDNVLRQRAFGANLYLEEVYKAIRNNVVGLSFVNVKITSPSAKLDVDGNLIITRTEVVTRGTVTVTTEVAPVTEI